MMSAVMKPAKAQKMPVLQGVSDKFELTDGKQKIEVYPTDGDIHTKEYTLIYLPGSKVLVEADAYSPGPADAPVPAMPPPLARTSQSMGFMRDTDHTPANGETGGRGVWQSHGPARGAGAVRRPEAVGLLRAPDAERGTA